MLSKLDKKIIGLISCDIPLTDRPFKELASKLGIEENKLLSRINYYKKKGILRKFSAVINHRKIGFTHNAMVVWNVPDRFIKKAGNLIAASSYVSHCYQRKKASGWNYNLYAMVHEKSKNACISAVRRIAKNIGSRDYKVLFSSKEYKKRSVKY